jgi:hypothetical protein
MQTVNRHHDYTTVGTSLYQVLYNIIFIQAQVPVFVQYEVFYAGMWNAALVGFLPGTCNYETQLIKGCGRWGNGAFCDNAGQKRLCGITAEEERLPEHGGSRRGCAVLLQKRKDYQNTGGAREKGLSTS